MKSTNISNRFFLLLLPFLLTGCYTQFQTTDRFPLEKDRYSDYYAWDQFDERKSSQDGAGQESYYEAEEEAYMEEIYALEEADIYYKNYEVEQWYKDHYPHRYYWKGYDDGYGNGYEDGFDGGYERAAQQYASNSYFYGYKPWAYNSWHFNSHRFHRHYIWGAGFGIHFSGVSGLWVSNMRYDIYSPTGYWYYDSLGYLRYWYHPFKFYGFYSNYGYGPSYGYGGFYNNPYYYTHVIYNNYNKTNRYRRSAELYRKGPRNSGLVNRDSYRSRSKSDYTPRTRGSSIRTRGINNGSRVRSTGRSGSVGRSSGNVDRSRGSSSSGSSRSRGSGSNINRSSSNNNGSGTSVGRSRSNNDSGSSVNRLRSSSGNSSSRSRGSGNLSSNDDRHDINRSSTSRINRSVYSVPVKRVINNRRVNTSRSSFLNNRNTFRSTQNRNSVDLKFGNSNVRSNKSSSIFGRSVRKAINNSSSRSSNVTRSSKTKSVSRSTSSRSSSKSSSKSSGSSKRSRGGN